MFRKSNDTLIQFLLSELKNVPLLKTEEGPKLRINNIKQYMLLTAEAFPSFERVT